MSISMHVHCRNRLSLVSGWEETFVLTADLSFRQISALQTYNDLSTTDCRRLVCKAAVLGVQLESVRLAFLSFPR